MPGESDPNEQPVSNNEIIVYPPKFQKKEQGTNIWLKSFISLALYLVLGYYIFHSFAILLLITAIIIFHELGHFLAMKYFRYNELGIFFIPLLGAYVSGSKREVSQKESAIILLAGPLPGIILGIILYLLHLQNPQLKITSNIGFDTASGFLIFLNLLNLLPVYPLDGGQLLNRVFFEEDNWISKLFIFLSAVLLCWVVFYLYSKTGISLYFTLLIFPLMMFLQMFGSSKLNAVEKKIEEEDINADFSYENLPDENYWKMRKVLVTEHPAYKDVDGGPPYEYHPKEEKIMSTIESLLHRHLIQDVSVVGKIFISLIWIAAFASPWLIDMDMSFFNQFRF